MTRGVALLAIVILGVAPGLRAQENPSVAAAQAAYARLDYDLAIRTAERALEERLTRDERIVAYELLGLAYGALDSNRLAVDAFRELIFLDPDREPDPVRVSPRITSLYASALGQVLVIRKVEVNDVPFVAGEGGTSVRFEITRPARVTARVVGGGVDLPVDSASVGVGTGQLRWSVLRADSTALPAGRYDLIVEAASARDQFASRHPVVVTHGRVDTTAHLTSVPGYTLQEEYEQPGRNWRPLGVAALYTALASGASLALENTSLASPDRKEIGGVSFAVLLTGFVMSLKKPDPRPVPANILYNELLREELARRNAEIASQNARRRRQVMIRVQPPGGSP